MTQTVLVTGGAGYIGSHACKALRDAGFVPVTYDNLCTGWQEAVKFGPFEQGDLMDRARLDVFSQFLDPAGVEPAHHRQVEQTAVALMLIASGRGVAVMPDWVLRAHAGNPELALLPLGPQGMLRRLYAAVRADDLGQPFVAHVLRLARTEPVRMMRG